MDSEKVRDCLFRLFTGAGQPELIALSPGMKELFDTIREIAPEMSNVLLEGETGTGKKFLAQALHAHSLRRSGPFVVVNFEELSKSLLPSEFFGHARGAFTGADADKRGLAEAADGGTLFLDEINKTDLETQKKILRLAADREFRRVGEDKIRKVDAAIIAASNVDLWAEVKAGRFLQDLFFRLKVHFLRVPPLRERTEDIRPLLIRFMGEHARKFGKVVPELDADLWNLLRGHPWNGNVRELENSVATVFALARLGQAGLEKLRSYLGPKPLPGSGSKAAGGSAPSAKPELAEEDPKRLATLEVLRRSQWNIARAARALGISRQGLYYRINTWDLGRSS